MIITCPLCKNEHMVRDNLITKNTNSARCKFCKKTFSLNLNKSSELSAAAQQSGAPISPPMRKIGVSLSKGGVGKTTTAVNLATGLAKNGKKVLLIDTDTQGQCSYMLGVNPKAGLTELLTDEAVFEEAALQVRGKLWLLSGGRALAGMKRVIDRKDFGGEMTLSESLADIEGKFDYVVVDTSPGWNPLTVNVMFYVNEIMSTVSLEVMTLQGLMEFSKSMASIQKYKKDLQLRYVVPTFLDNRVKKSEAIYQKLKGIYGTKLCDPIRYNSIVAESPAHGKCIIEYDPQSKGALDYNRLVKRVLADEQSQEKADPAEFSKIVNG